MTIQEKQQQLRDEFALVTDWMDRYQMIIDYGQHFISPKESIQKPENLIQGCQSRVWIACREEQGRLWFDVDSDAVITKGIAALIVNLVNGHTPQEILAEELEILDEIGLRENLSPTRANGLLSMLARIRSYAQAQRNEPSTQQ